MSTKVEPEENAIHYSPSMFESAAQHEHSQPTVLKDDGIPLSTKSVLPSQITDQCTVQFTNPAFCGFACARRFPPTPTSSTPPQQQIGIDALSFIYEFNGQKLPNLQIAFEQKFASLHQRQFRFSCLGGAVAMSVYGAYDWHYYRTTDFYVQLVLLRFAGFLPCLLLAGSLTYSTYYWKAHIRTLLLSLLSFALGLFIVMYSFVTRGANQGTFALYFALLFFLTPLPFSRQLLIGVVLWTLYLFPLLVSEVEADDTEWKYSELISFDIIQAWSTLLASLFLYIVLRYYQIRHLCADTFFTFLLRRNRDAAHEEREKASELLLSCLPKEIITQLENQQWEEENKSKNSGGATITAVPSTQQFARHHNSVTVIFCQVCNVAKIVALLDSSLGHRRGSTALVIILNSIFTCFDEIMDQSHCKKIETVMDVYMAVCGAPVEVQNHADLACYCACLMIASKQQVRQNIASELRKNIQGQLAVWKIQSLVENVCAQFDIHIGLNSGSINSGIIGNVGPRYKIFGDVVNTASRMESTAPYGVVQCSRSTSELVSKNLFECIEQESIKVKGKGEMKPYYVTSKVQNIITTAAPLPIPVIPVAPVTSVEGGGTKGGEKQPRKAEAVRHPHMRRNSTSVLREITQSTSTNNSSTTIHENGHNGNEHLNDFIKEYNHTHPETAASTTTTATLTSAQYTAMGLHGSPILPFASWCSWCSWCSCCCGLKREVVPPVIVAYHCQQEIRFEHKQSQQQMSSLRKMAILTFVAAASLTWLDVQQYNSYYNHGICWELNANECVDKKHLSNHELHRHQSLCSWNTTLDHCLRNTSIRSDATPLSGCQWTYELDPGSHSSAAFFQQRANQQLFFSLLVRFAGIGMFSLLLIVLTYWPWFQKHPYGSCQQTIGGILVFGLGFFVGTLSWLSGFPGVGSVICWIFLAMVTSNVRYIYRMVVLLSLCLTFGLMLYFYNPYKSETSLCTAPANFVGTKMVYLICTFLSAGVPIAKREAWARSEFGRKETIAHSEILLNELHSKTHALLSALLPPHVVTLLSTQQRHERRAIAEYYSDVSIIFTDMKGFTKYSSSVTPSELVIFLNDMYNRFDVISENCSIFKVEIIGDAYFGCAGAPTPAEDHADKIARGALAFLDSVSQMKIDTPLLAEKDVQIRIGVHSGAVVAGVVGAKDPRYHLFGTNVSYAERMESSGVPGKIQASDAFAKEVALYIGSNKCAYKIVERSDSSDNTWFIERSDSNGSKNGSAADTGSIRLHQKNKRNNTKINRNATFPRSKSSNSVALAAWDEEDDE